MIFAGTFLGLVAVFALAMLIDIWSQARADILVANAVADYELRRALDRSMDNFCRRCVCLMLQEMEERNDGLR